VFILEGEFETLMRLWIIPWRHTANSQPCSPIVFWQPSPPPRQTKIVILAEHANAFSKLILHKCSCSKHKIFCFWFAPVFRLKMYGYLCLPHVQSLCMSVRSSSLIGHLAAKHKIYRDYGKNFVGRHFHLKEFQYFSPRFIGSLFTVNNFVW
jgi:hypothetical protein